jgi:RNA polymerase sigma-70 factor (ECF subfamily)
MEKARTHGTGPDKRGGMDHTDAARLRLLYEKHAAALWRYGRSLTNDSCRAEDLVQETLLRAWRHREITDDGNHSSRAWLFAVARNLVIDDSRSSRFRKEVRMPDYAGFADLPGAVEVDATLDRLLFDEALAQLSAAHQAVIRRSYYLTWSTAEIARDLHVPEGTVKSRLHFAVRALRVALLEMGITS